MEEMASVNGEARARIGNLEAQLVASREASSAAIARLEDRLVASRDMVTGLQEALSAAAGRIVALDASLIASQQETVSTYESSAVSI